MKRLAELLGDLAEAPHAAARLRRLEDHLGDGADLGWRLAWLTGALKPPRMTPAKLRALAEKRIDPALFRLSAAALGDVGETVALIWPGAGDLPVAAVASGDMAPAEVLDRLDAEARVAFVRLLTGRRLKGVRRREVHVALGRAQGADPDLVAGALIEEAPPYPRLCDWLLAGGPAPNWAPPKPPPLPRIETPLDDAFDAWPLPDGAPVGVRDGRAFDGNGEEVRVSSAGPDGWGFADRDEVKSPLSDPPLGDARAAHRAGAPLLVRFRQSGDWAIWPPPGRTIICPVTFIESARVVSITLGVTMDAEMAPLIKLASPDPAKVSAFARKAMIDKFGPVRQVRPGLWAELSYDALRPAPRRKIGVTLEGARIERLIWGDGPPPPDLSALTEKSD